MSQIMMPICVGLAIISLIGGVVATIMGANAADMRMTGQGFSMSGMGMFFLGAAITSSAGDA